jgi:hypothetical protein
MARAKVRWTSMFSRGGMKIINPQLQIKALITKLILRGLLLGWAPWKKIIK